MTEIKTREEKLNYINGEITKIDGAQWMTGARIEPKTIDCADDDKSLREGIARNLAKMSSYSAQKHKS